MAPDKPVGLAEVAAMLRVSKNTALRYSGRTDFPAAVERLATGRVWRSRDVEAWAKKVLPLPVGRSAEAPRKTALEPEVREYLRQLGARGGKVGGPKGGKARAEKLTAEERSAIARRAARARWAKPRKRKPQ